MVLLCRILYAFLLLVLQTSWFALFPGYNVTPDFLLLFVVYYAMYIPTKIGTVNGLAVGAIQDIMSATIFGFHILTRTFVAYSIGKLKERVMRENIEAYLAFVLGASVFCRLAYAVLQTFIAGMQVFWLPSYLVATFFYLVINIVMAIPFWFCSKKLEELLIKRNSY